MMNLNINAIITIIFIVVVFNNCKNVSLNSKPNSEIGDTNITTNHYPDFNNMYMGVIDDANNEIIMSLNNISGNLKGYYYHRDGGGYIKTEGEVGVDGLIKLKLYDVGNNIIGIMKGEIINTEIQGIWETPDSSIVLQFYVSEAEYSAEVGAESSNKSKEQYAKEGTNDERYREQGDKGIADHHQESQLTTDDLLGKWYWRYKSLFPASSGIAELEIVGNKRWIMSYFEIGSSFGSWVVKSDRIQFYQNGGRIMEGKALADGNFQLTFSSSGDGFHGDIIVKRIIE